MQRRQIPFSIGIAWLASVVVLATPTFAGADQVGSRTPSHAYGDLDADGVTDRVFGYPSHDSSRGAIVVVYGSGVVEAWDRDSPGVLDGAYVDDHFGDSVGIGDIDGDGYDDIAVGVPGDSVSFYANAGRIHILYGSASGVTAVGDQILSRSTSGINENPWYHDYFGESIAVADFNCDGYADVAAGAPLDDAHNNRVDDGSISVIFGSSSGLSTVDDFFHQGTSGVSGAPENYDHFGGSLATGNFDGDAYLGRACMDLAVGVLGENNGAGYIVPFYGDRFSHFTHSTGTGVSQNVTYAEGTAAAGDGLAAVMWSNSVSGSYDDLFVTIPGDSCPFEGGSVQRFRSHANGITSSQRLNNPSDVLQCIQWDGETLATMADDYLECVDFSEPNCGASLTTAILGQPGDGLINYGVACMFAMDVALEACEHWLEDPQNCDVDLCLQSALELDAVSLGCEMQGDVFPHGY